MNRKITIISDFDGTISERDIGHHFFGTFIPDKEQWQELLRRWKFGLVSSKECLEHEISWVKARRKDLDQFIGNETLDPYFKDFVDFCNRRRFDILILSDGLDYYIDYLLMKFGLGFLRFKANKLVLRNGNISGIAFPYYNMMECTMCANCKKYHLEQLKEEGHYIIYVGNGFSDRCPAGYADMVLAKGDLLDHCQQEEIDCIPFSNFRDVERELTTRLILSR